MKMQAHALGINQISKSEFDFSIAGITACCEEVCGSGELLVAFNRQLSEVTGAAAKLISSKGSPEEMDLLFKDLNDKLLTAQGLLQEAQ